MIANIKYSNYLPNFIREGSAELTCGIDNKYKYTIKDIASGKYNSLLSQIYDKFNPQSRRDHLEYSAGYMLLRYLAKQVSDTYPYNPADTWKLPPSIVNISIESYNKGLLDFNTYINKNFSTVSISQASANIDISSMTSQNETAVIRAIDGNSYVMAFDNDKNGIIELTSKVGESVSNNTFYVADTSNTITSTGDGEFQFSSEWKNFTEGAVFETVDASNMGKNSHVAIAAVHNIKTGAGVNIAWGYNVDNVNISLKKNSGYDMAILWDGVDKNVKVDNFEFGRDEIWLYGKGNVANGEELTFLTDIDSVINQYNITKNQNSVVITGKNGSQMTIGGNSDTIKIFTTPDHANIFTVKFEGSNVNYYDADNKLVGTQK